MRLISNFSSRLLSVSALALISTFGFAASAFAHTEFAFGALSAETQEHVTIFMGEDEDLSGTSADVNEKTDGRLALALKDAEFEGKFGKKLHLYGLSPFARITVIGTGDENLSTRDLRDLGGYVAQASDNEKDLSVMVDGLDTNVDTAAAQIAMGYALSSYEFTKYKENAKEIDRTVAFHSDNMNASKSLYEGDLEHVVTGVNFARDMGTEPGKSIYPESFAQGVRELFSGVAGVKIDVLGVSDMRRNKMGALMGVGQGSVHDPRLIVISYMGGTRGEDPVALVGKGITFDTGGISIKPNTGQWAMKSDLSGAAAVAGTVYAVAKRSANANLVGVMAMAENMPAADAIRPGDVLETMSGKTIEVMSTDAEGRLVLSDAMTYVQKEYDPSLLIDIATLTGSVGRALGYEYAGVISHDWDLSMKMMEVGKRVGEDVWPLPLNDAHFKAIKSDIADLKSTAGRPGASIGGAVIGTFVDEDRPWIHLDIAGVDWLDKATPTSPKGHAGWGVRFMDGVVRDVEKK
ncbi:MAG: leucyl aminopeptidase [Acidimicrobiales bacterium]|nr:leucyl aminopeptidase [Hyphomonadaceae bacterium]RZV41011.1 MAG: leucyl aminopeptidase [Acidimicrobiales bacterium]